MGELVESRRNGSTRVILPDEYIFANFPKAEVQFACEDS